MPYIEQHKRDVAEIKPSTAGELNFAFTKLIMYYWGLDPNYQTINDIVGALEGAKLEFYRRIAVPYENEKIISNGDVY